MKIEPGISIYPTHTCFDDAVGIMAIILNRNGIQVAEQIKIVHAIIAPYGEKISHAWIEYKGRAYFMGFIEGKKRRVMAPIAPYEAGLNIVHVTRYTIDEAVAEELRTGMKGPWVPEYRELCADIQKRKENDNGQSADGD